MGESHNLWGDISRLSIFNSQNTWSMFFFLITLFRSRVSFSRSLPYGSLFSPTWNLGSLLDLSLVPVFSQAPLLVLDYRCSHNLPTYQRTVFPNWYRTHTVSKFGLQSSWITGGYYGFRHLNIMMKAIQSLEHTYGNHHVIKWKKKRTINRRSGFFHPANVTV